MARAPALVRLILLIALLGAVSLRLLSPPGWMPASNDRSGFALVICTGEGSYTVNLPGDHAPSPDNGKTQHTPCAFSGVAFTSTPSAIPVAGPAEQPAITPVSAPTGLLATGPRRTRPQSPRAPPTAV
jgi:hypothetical protein